ncbi:MAG: hypothetical protein IBX56_08325 [Methylomicrobium sp.]|nr:hypothetical protein [Methylomicrobium sp.]
MTKKSRWVSFILTLIFGPIGLLYASPIAGVLMIAAGLLIQPAVIGMIGLWVLSVAIGDHLAYKHNKSVDRLEELIAGR